MAVDIYHSRRTKYKECYYWTRYEKGDPSEFILKNKPEGNFWAREINSKELQNNAISNAFLFDSEYITLETSDDIKIKNNDLVQYLGHVWFVKNVSEVAHIKESEFSNTLEYTHFINLRR